jgi:hypothetical protein
MVSFAILKAIRRVVAAFVGLYGLWMYVVPELRVPTPDLPISVGFGAALIILSIGLWFGRRWAYWGTIPLALYQSYGLYWFATHSLFGSSSSQEIDGWFLAQAVIWAVVGVSCIVVAGHFLILRLAPPSPHATESRH